MAELYLTQYDNAHKVYPSMLPFEMKTQTFPYCFFNNGPDRDGFETIERIFNEIDKNFDTALVSIGPYGCILADRLNSLGKTTLTVGSGLPKVFAVEPGRKEEYWLGEIPEQYIPTDYKKIENGRYWVCQK